MKHPRYLETYIHAGYEQNNKGLLSATTALVGHVWSTCLILVKAIIGIADSEFAMVVTSRNGNGLMEMQVGYGLLFLDVWRVGDGYC